MELDLWDERAGGRGWTLRQALGDYNRLGDILPETGSERVCGKVEAGWRYDACAGAASVSLRRARLRARAQEIGAEMESRGRASGRRAEVGVRAEVAGWSRGLGGDRACR